MEQQMNLGEAYARTTDPGTSHAAAQSIRGRDATVLELTVLSCLMGSKDGLTTHEIAERTGLEYGSVTPRIRPLIRKGMVVDSGARRVPHGRSKKGIVWRAV